MSERGRRRRLVVLGTMASDPYAGMAWMHMQIAAGLPALGHDVYYFETTSAWPYDPSAARVHDSDYAVPYLARSPKGSASGTAGRTAAATRTRNGSAWAGDAEELLAHAEAVFNVGGATRLAEEGLQVGRLVYLGTDPVVHEIGYANGEARRRADR